MRAPLYFRVEADLKKGNLQGAINRLQGALHCNPLNAGYNYKLATIFYWCNNSIKAGRYWYFRLNKNQLELEAVKSFERSLGDDPVLILKRLINQQFFRISLLNSFEIKLLRTLLERVRGRQATLPKFLNPLVMHLRKRERDDVNNDN